MSMVDEALRDPISVGMLKIDGVQLLEMGEKAGPRVGWILHALLEEVLEDPAKNTTEYLEETAKKLIKMENDELKMLGEAGKERKFEEEAGEVQRLREKHRVS